MALAPRSSLIFSSSVAATGILPAAPGADTRPAAPAVQPPVTTARPDRSCQKLPAGGPRTCQEETTILHPLHGVTDKACLNAPQDPSAYPTPDHGSCSTPEPAPVKPPRGIPEVPIPERGSPRHPRGPPRPEGPTHPVRDPPRRTQAVTDQPAQCSPAAPGV